MVTDDALFRVLRNPGGGDCLFHVLHQATGTSVANLKLSVAARATSEEFRVKKAMYESAKRGATDPHPDPEYVRDYLDYAWMEGIRTLRDYRDALARRGTWGDGESLQHLEDILNCRLLVLRDLVDPYPIPSSVKLPRFYVLIHYDSEAAHFELITYAGRGMLVAVPDAIKRMFGMR